MPTPIIVLAEQLKADSIWKTASLLGVDVPFSAAASVAGSGVGCAGRPIGETMLLDRLSEAWETMMANAGRPLDGTMFAYYRNLLSSPRDLRQPMVPARDAEDTAIGLFLGLWPRDRILAAMTANHVLVHAGVGLFGMYPRQLPEFESILDRSAKDAVSYLRDNAVELLPGGLTRRRKAEYDRRQKR